MSIQLPKVYIFDLSGMFGEQKMTMPPIANACLQPMFDDDAAVLIPERFFERHQEINHLLATKYDVVVKVHYYSNEPYGKNRVKFSIIANEPFGVSHEFIVMKNRGDANAPKVYELKPGPSEVRDVPAPRPLFLGVRPYTSKVASGSVLADKLAAYSLTQIHPFNHSQKAANLPDGLELLELVRRELSQTQCSLSTSATESNLQNEPHVRSALVSFKLGRDKDETFDNLWNAYMDRAYPELDTDDAMSQPERFAKLHALHDSIRTRLKDYPYALHEKEQWLLEVAPVDTLAPGLAAVTTRNYDGWILSAGMRDRNSTPMHFITTV